MVAVITYRTSLSGVTAAQLRGFFVGWPAPPPPGQRLALLQGSAHVVLAFDGDRVVGFVNAISDGVLSAFIPLLEVLPAWQGRGIGSELVRQMLAELAGHYSVDVVCDEEVRPFYERLGGIALTGMAWRNRA